MTEDHRMVGVSPDRTSFIPDHPGFDGEFDVRWRRSVPSHGDILVVDGTVYVETEQETRGETEYGIVGYDLDDGTGVSRFDFPESGRCFEIVSDGRLLFGVTNEQVTAYNLAAERTQWTHDYREDRPDVGFKSVLVVDGTVYTDLDRVPMMRAGFADSPDDVEVIEIALQALGANDGEGRRISVREVPNTWSGPLTRIAYRDGQAFLGIDTEIVAVDIGSRDVSWTKTIEVLDEADFYSAEKDAFAVGPQGVYFGTRMAKKRVDGPPMEELDPRVEVIDPTTGTRQWQVQLPQSGAKSIAVGEDVVLVLLWDGGLLAFDPADGSRRWENYDVERSIVVVDDTVYTMAAGDLVGLSVDDGSERWRYQLPSDASGSLGNGIFVLDDAVLLRGAELLCLEPTGGGDSGGVTETTPEGDRCPDCGEMVDDGAEFCPNCGSHLDTNACPNCGESLDGDEAFCPGCGTELSDTDACHECGADLDGDEAFCPSCGADLSTQ